MLYGSGVQFTAFTRLIHLNQPQNSCVCEAVCGMFLLDSHAIMSAFLVSAHSTSSIKTEWMLALSITITDSGARYGRNYWVNHVLKTPEIISL
jgi:hypothetical protein